MTQWIFATLSVILLIFILARGLKWMLERTRRDASTVSQVASWRVAPDASVRAIRTFGRVHLLYERGRESVLLESLEKSDYDLRSELPRPQAVAMRSVPPPAARVAKA